MPSRYHLDDTDVCKDTVVNDRTTLVGLYTSTREPVQQFKKFFQINFTTLVYSTLVRLPCFCFVFAFQYFLQSFQEMTGQAHA